MTWRAGHDIFYETASVSQETKTHGDIPQSD